MNSVPFLSTPAVQSPRPMRPISGPAVWTGAEMRSSEDWIHRLTVPEASELVSLQGNLARHEDGTPFTHIHATFTADDCDVHGGHLFTATVHVVAEIHLRVLSQAIMTRCPVENSDFVALRFS